MYLGTMEKVAAYHFYLEVIYALIGIKISQMVTSAAAIAKIHFQETQRSGARYRIHMNT
jgi:hypothetical protein